MNQTPTNRHNEMQSGQLGKSYRPTHLETAPQRMHAQSYIPTANMVTEVIHAKLKETPPIRTESLALPLNAPILSVLRNESRFVRQPSAPTSPPHKISGGGSLMQTVRNQQVSFHAALLAEHSVTDGTLGLPAMQCAVLLKRRIRPKRLATNRTLLARIPRSLWKWNTTIQSTVYV